MCGHYDTHLVNNDGEVGGFHCLTVAMMCEDPENHKLIRKATKLYDS